VFKKLLLFAQRDNAPPPGVFAPRGVIKIYSPPKKRGYPGRDRFKTLKPLKALSEKGPQKRSEWTPLPGAEFHPDPPCAVFKAILLKLPAPKKGGGSLLNEG